MANLGRLAVAMLGVLAYQNRDKIGELLRGNRDRDLPEAINKLTPNGVLPPIDAEDVSLLDPVSPRTER